MRVAQLSLLLTWVVVGLSALVSATTLEARSPEIKLEKPHGFHNQTEIDACKSLKHAAPGSDVYYPLSLQYGQFIEHYMTSATERPACVFYPKTPQDLSAAIKLIGHKRIRSAFSSGGHASIKGFSSTKGIHVTLKGFQQLKLSSDKRYIDVGSGNIWDNVYQYLDGSGVNVVGGRVSGVGVGGFVTGGGGYSWKTNQYGLTGDTLLKADIVLPNGTITTASPSKNPNIFWAIRGGGNRFGIVYNMRLKTHPQVARVYGGLRFYTSDKLDEIVKATIEFQENNKDPKAQIIPTFNFVLGQPSVALLGFYDDSQVPATAFSAFDKATVGSLVDGWKTRSFPDLVRSSPSNTTSGLRGAFHTVSLQKYSLDILNLIVSELKHYGNQSAGHSGTFISYDVEPFLPYSQFAKDAAWPHKTNALPLNIYFAWLNPADDAFWHTAIKASADKITEQARKEGQKLDQLYLYPNYAINGTDPKRIYGQESLNRLTQIRKQVDPKDVMGLTTFWTGF